MDKLRPIYDANNDAWNIWMSLLSLNIPYPSRGIRSQFFSIREEKSPSAYLYYGTNERLWMIIDFGIEARPKPRNPYNYLVDLCGFSKKDAFKKLIDADFIPVQNSISGNQRVASEFHFEYNVQDFTISDQEFWSSYGIDENTLEEYEVKSISSYQKLEYQNEELIDTKTYYRGNYHPLMYAIQIGISDRIYMPDPNEEPKNFKHHGNWADNEIFGLKQSKNAEINVGATGMKDVLTAQCLIANPAVRFTCLNTERFDPNWKIDAIITDNDEHGKLLADFYFDAGIYPITWESSLIKNKDISLECRYGNPEKLRKNIINQLEKL